MLLENIGETDAGRPEPLAEFGKWAVEKYPAEHYALVIWNHGAGWAGVSSDDNTQHGMDLPDVRWALEKICEKTKAQGKDKLDLVDFDACLMATLEVAYELKDTTDFLVASQETEPGAGMQYTDYLRWIATYPESPAASFAKNLVETYVKSYAPEGSQAAQGPVGRLGDEVRDPLLARRRAQGRRRGRREDPAARSPTCSARSRRRSCATRGATAAASSTSTTSSRSSSSTTRATRTSRPRSSARRS